MASLPRAEMLPADHHGEFLSGYSAKRIFFTYCRCPRCELVYCPIYYSDAQLRQLYGLQAENMADLPFAARARTQERYVRALMPELVPDGDYLEIGADIGLFAQLCSARKRFRHAWLYEPNVGVRTEIDRRLSGVEYSVISEHVALTSVPRDTVSLGVAVHVLDHILKPRETLELLHATMVRGGRLFIVTHDERSLLARLLGRRWPPYTLQHPQLYSTSTLQQLAERSGFTVIRVIKTVNYIPVFFLFRAMLQIMGLSDRFAPMWAHPQIGVRLGNIGLVAVKS